MGGGGACPCLKIVDKRLFIVYIIKYFSNDYFIWNSSKKIVKLEEVYEKQTQERHWEVLK